MLLISPWRTACCLPKLFNPKIFLVASPAKEAKLPINLPTPADGEASYVCERCGDVISAARRAAHRAKNVKLVVLTLLFAP